MEYLGFSETVGSVRTATLSASLIAIGTGTLLLT